MNYFKPLKDGDEVRKDNNHKCLSCIRNKRYLLSDLSLCADSNRKCKTVKVPRPSLYESKLQTGSTNIVMECPNYIQVEE